MDPEVEKELYKYMSVSLCPNLPGQVLLETMINPPTEGDASYKVFNLSTIRVVRCLYWSLSNAVTLSSTHTHTHTATTAATILPQPQSLYL